MYFLQDLLVQHNNYDIDIWEFESEDDLEFCSTTVAKNTADDVNPPEEMPECEKSILKLVSFIYTFLFACKAVFRIQDGALDVLFNFVSLMFRKLLNFTRSEHIRTLHQFEYYYYYYSNRSPVISPINLP